MSSEGPEAARWRRAIYRKGAPHRTDLVNLIALAAGADAAEFLGLVGDVARDALLAEGQLACPDADWLRQACDDARALGSPAPFAALASVLRHAATPPAELVALAAREIERAILTGERAAIGGQDGEPGRVTASDVTALRAIGLVARPDRATAAVLFDIAHATATADNDPGFESLFCETLRGYLNARASADMRFDDFLTALAQIPPHTGAVDGLADARYREAAETNAVRCEAAARLPATDARWALAHLCRGALTSAERRLVAGLRGPTAPATQRAA